MLARMVLPGEYDDPSEDGEPAPAASRGSLLMPTSVRGLAVGILVCIVVIAVCLAALAGAVGLLVG